MGSGGSKPADDASRHVFSAETPVRFSQQVIEQLQDSPDTDSTRARNLELKIQSRVNAELSKIRDIESQRLTEQTASLTPTDIPSPDSSDSASESISSKISSALTPGSSDAEKRAARTHDSVKAEIDALKKKLDGRKTLEKPSEGVTKAKEELVQCLRMNDRRPLDCWREVEEFKARVGEVEKGFVEGAIR